MIATVDSHFKSGSARDGDIVDRSSHTSMKHLAKTDLVEDLNGNNDIEDMETGTCLSFVSSTSVDSGFSSSDAEDHVTDGLLNVSCGLCSDDTDNCGTDGLLNVSCVLCSDDTDNCVTDGLLNVSHCCHCDTDDHVTDGLLFVGCNFNGECGELKINQIIDNGDDSMMISGNDGRIVKQGHRKFIHEDEQLEKRNCGCFVDESDKENKVKCDDLDDEGKNMMQVICSRDEDQVDKIEDVDVGNTVNSFQSVKLTCCSESPQLDSSCERTESSELRKHPTVEMCLDRTLLYTRCVNIEPGDMCDKDISTDKQIHNRTRETADPVYSAVKSCKLRTISRRRRKCHVQDVNNNSAGPRSLTSFLRRVPFTFYDCFQEMGLLSLVACIIYTLVLMVILSAVSMIMETIKSAIGTENLKKIRKIILRYRHTRMSLATG